MNDLISIIVPAYNSEKTIKRCIDSIANQSYKNIEIVVINDGSTDKTLDILYHIECKNIKIISIPNCGPAHARNVGIDNASGDWIMFCDSDDEFCSNICEELLSLCIKHNAEMAFCNLKNIFNSGIEKDVVIFSYNKYIFTENDIPYLQKIIISRDTDTRESIIALSGPYCKIFKRSLINGCRFPEYINLGEDTCFILNAIVNISKAVYINKNLYYRYFGENSLSNSGYKEDVRLAEYMNWIDKYAETYPYLIYSVSTLRCKLILRIINLYLRKNSTLSYNEKTRRILNYINNCVNPISMIDIRRSDISKIAKLKILLLKLNIYFPLYIYNKIRLSK